MVELIEQIKANLSTDEALTRSGVNISRRRGRRVVGLCPFHNEKTGSFTVYVDQWRAHCYGCQWSGDMVDLLAGVNHRTNAEQIKELAAEFGLLEAGPGRRQCKSAPAPYRPRINETERKALFAELARVRREMDSEILAITDEKDLEAGRVAFALEYLLYADQLLDRIENMDGFDFGAIWRAKQLAILWDIAGEEVC